MKTRGIAAAASVALIALAGACSGGGSDSLSDRTLVLHGPSDPGILDPHSSPGSFGRTLTRFAYDTLVADGPDGEVQSQLAESWDVTPTRAAFTIKEGVRCDDGSDLSASDVAANFERLKDPAAEVPFTASFLGSTDFTVTADDETRKVVLKLPEPFSPLLSNLAFYPGIVCPEGLENPEQLRAKTFGTGPFKVGNVEAGRSYTFEVRDGYSWGPGGATTDDVDFPQEVEVRVVDNETTAANLMVSGDLDFGVFQTRGAYERLDRDGFGEEVVPSSATYIHFNFLKDASPVQELGVRRALSETLDRTAMSKVATGEEDQVAQSIALPQAPCQDDIGTNSLIDFDPDSVEKDLTDAGWTRSGDGWEKDGTSLTINLLVSGIAGPNKPLADYVLNAWTEAGIDVEIDNTDQATSVERRAEGTYDVWIGAWGSVFNFPIITPFLTEESSPNYSFLANEKFNTITEEILASDPEQTCDLWADAQDAINDEVSMVPMYYDATRWKIRDGLTVEPYRNYVDPTSLRVQ